MRQVAIPLPEPAQVRRTLILAVSALLLLYVVYLVREIWLPLGLAFLLAMVLDPVVDRMESRGWSRTGGAAFIFGSFILIAGGLIVLAAPFLVHQFEELQRGFARYFPDTTHAGLSKAVKAMNIPPWLGKLGIGTFEGLSTGFQRSSTWVTDYGMRFLSNSVWVVIVPIVSFYSLRDFHLILAKGLMLVPRGKRDLVQTAVVDVTAVFARYLRGLMIVSILNGVATALLLALLGVPSAALVGIAAGLLYSVPYIGAMMTIVLTAAVAFVGGGVQLAVLAVAASVILHQVVFDQIVAPRILGAHVGLHPIISIVALLVGNLLLGIVGMILAVPVAACIQLAVLSLVPKLGLEFEVPSPSQADSDSVSSLEEETKDDHIRIDATQELHTLVANAVEEIEAKELNDAESIEVAS